MPPLSQCSSDVLAFVQRAAAADLLDRATQRMASILDESDTDEGLERRQTELNGAIQDAIGRVLLSRDSGSEAS